MYTFTHVGIKWNCMLPLRVIQSSMSNTKMSLAGKYQNLVPVLIAVLISIYVVGGQNVTEPEASSNTTLVPPKIRIVVQHLILPDEDERRRAEPTAVADESSRQESTLELITDIPNKAVVLDEKLYQESVVHLECVAPYPVEWVYVGEGYPDPVLTFLETKRNSINYSNPSSYTYSSKLDLITLSERSTGRYTCRSLSDSEHDVVVRQAYFYIYVPGKSVFVTDQPAIKSKVTPPAMGNEADGFELLLPCTVTNPNTTLTLYKVNKKSTYLQEIRGASYDPSHGFTLKSITPWGIYVCITEDKKRLMMAFTKPNRTFSPGASRPRERVQFSFDSSLNSFLCCVNSSESIDVPKPDMRYITCSSPAECQIRKHGHGRSYQYGELIPNEKNPSQLCAAMNANQTRTSLPLGPPPSTGNYRFLTATREKSNNGPSGGMFQCRIGAHIEDFYFLWRNSNPIPVLGFETTPTYSEFIQLTLKLSSTTSSSDKAQIIRSIPVRVECTYNSFLFTKGHVWLFGFKNGTSAIVNKEHITTNHYYAEPQVEDSEDEGGLREFTTIAFPDTNITSLICSVPHVSSSDWRNVSTLVTVLDK